MHLVHLAWQFLGLPSKSSNQRELFELFLKSSSERASNTSTVFYWQMGKHMDDIWIL